MRAMHKRNGCMLATHSEASASKGSFSGGDDVGAAHRPETGSSRSATRTETRAISGVARISGPGCATLRGARRRSGCAAWEWICCVGVDLQHAWQLRGSFLGTW